MSSIALAAEDPVWPESPRNNVRERMHIDVPMLFVAFNIMCTCYDNICRFLFHMLVAFLHPCVKLDQHINHPVSHKIQ